MQEAKRALDKAVSGKKSDEQQSEVKNRIFNTIPLFRKGFYKHPSELRQVKTCSINNLYNLNNIFIIIIHYLEADDAI